jgi:hypothetical protein
MKRVYCIALAITALPCATAFAQFVRMAPLNRAFAPLNRAPDTIVADEAQAFGYIARELHLDGPNSVEQLMKESSIDHLRDYDGQAVFAVKPELLGLDSVSHVRDADGNYPFFVFGQSEHGWRLLGTMRGRGYTWSTESRHLLFDMSAAGPGGASTVTRYEVNPGFLVNLTELALEERQPDIPATDWRTAF